jgi:Ca2+-binding RTX toxin-like protein
MPSLNEARAQFQAAAGGDSQLDPYTSWADFALNLKNPASIVNFIAAYGTHELITDEDSIAGKRAAAMALVFGTEQTFRDGIDGLDKVIAAPDVADRLAFLNGTGIWNAANSGLDSVDLWMGGLAEKKMDFGGMLGSTFSAVFELQMENLQDGDRFYYLSRVQGLNLLSELENNSLAKMVLRNTDLGADGTAIPGDIFSRPDLALYIDEARQTAMTGLADPEHANATLQAISKMVDRRDTDSDGVIDYMRYNGVDHAVMQGSSGDDTLIGGEGDDSLWGGDGNDRLDGGYGVDHVHGGAGDDIITNSGTDIGAADFLHGEEGNDVMHGGSGLSLMFGNKGQDFMVGGPDGKTVMGGIDDDFIRGGDGIDFLLGEAGDDWLEGGGRFDTLAGENSELFFNSTIIGHDVLNGDNGDVDYDAESGDDIMFQGVGIQRSNGMAGFDWAIHKGDVVAANSDLGIPIFATQEDFILRDRFDLVEGLSGWKHDDVLTGRVANVNTRAELTGTAAIPGPDSILDSYSSALLQKNVSLIAGLDTIVAHSVRTTETGNDGTVETIAFQSSDASDILLGGGGSDRVKGLAGNDVIDGDKWLNVRIQIAVGTVRYTADGMTKQVYLASDMVNGVLVAGAAAQFGGRSLDALMFDRTLNPGQLSIVREIVDGNQAGDIDTAVYTDLRVHYGFGVNVDGSLYVDHAPPATDETEVLGDNVEGVTEKPVLDGRDTVRNVERLEFTDLTMNVINGTGANETLYGDVAGTGLIHDVLMGFGGNDTLNGGSGDDVLIGGTGNDTLSGGSGDDIYVFGLADGQDTIQEASGTDKISIAAGGVALSALNFRRESNDDLLIDLNGQSIRVVDHFDSSSEIVETVSFDSGSYGGYDFYLADDEGDELFRGTYVLSTDDSGELTAAADVDTILIDDNVTSSQGNTTLTGNTGDDMLFGNGGNDTLNGGAGVDLLVGGSGNDIYVVDDLGDTVVELSGSGSGTDTIRTSLPSYTLDANIENMDFTGTGDFTGAGNGLNNSITAGDGADSLFGGDGADSLNGGDGNDSLHGGNGNDTLNGGSGTDVFMYDAAGFGNDTINSFDANATGGQDKIDLSALGITSGNFGTRVSETRISVSGTDDTMLTIRDAGGATIGTIRVDAVDPNDISSTDFILAGSTTINGSNSGQTTNGTAGNDIINGNGGNDTINGLAGNDTVDGGTGDDILNGGSGDDTIRWTAPATGSGGWDVIDGGSEGIAGDTFVLTGNSAYEIFRFYPAEDAELVIPGLVLKGTATEIVVTRSTVVAGVEGPPQVIAELSEIEEIVINGSPASGSGTAGGDRFELIGDFAEQGEETSLRTSTITIVGSEGDDTVDISALASAHRIIFKTKGGNDVIIGTLRPQDVVELEDGKTIADYVKTANADGSTTISSETHTVTFFTTGSGPQLGQGGTDDGIEDTDDDTDMPPVDEDDASTADDDDDDNDDNDDDDNETPSNDDDETPSTGAVKAGTPQADVLIGTGGNDNIIAFAGDDVAIGDGGADAISAGEGADFVNGGIGRDVIFAGAGDDHVFGGAESDIVYGDAGADRIFGDQGNDLITAGAGDDTVFGGSGNDLIVAEIGDGNDAYFGDEGIGGTGIDTLDMSAATADVTVNLGSGPLMNGSASSSQTGNDTIWGIENVNTGSGNDTIIASNAVNVMNGGAGNDTFKFLTTAAANGDTIHGFEPGDRIDLSGIDANTGMTTDQSFVLVNGAAQTTAGQLAISFETRADGEFTVLQGNVDGDSAAELRIEIEGHHSLTNSNFNL